MALKLVLLSRFNAIENKENQLYQIFDSKIKQNLIKLSINIWETLRMIKINL